MKQYQKICESCKKTCKMEIAKGQKIIYCPKYESKDKVSK
jgi:hypothetical protein